jgi:hypothetical protein
MMMHGRSGLVGVRGEATQGGLVELARFRFKLDPLDASRDGSLRFYAGMR